ncbi:MAG: GIY-YIG nuclease family protein [Chlamydiia bacterium]
MLEKEKSWIVYMIQTQTGALYTGITVDLERRLLQHQNKKGARYFHFSEPQRVMHQEPAATRSQATAREREIKGMTRKQKLQLIEQSSTPTKSVS